MGGIKFRALAISLFAFYVAPILPLVVVSSIPNFFGAAPNVGERMPFWHSGASLLLLWFWAVAPVGSGYLAAKLSQQQPLLHGLIAGGIGAVLVVLWVHGAWLFEFVVALIVIGSGLFGGWLCRRRSLRRNHAL
jgi:hypothetical protein